MATRKNRASPPKKKPHKGGKAPPSKASKAQSAQALNQGLAILHKKTGLGASAKQLAALPKKRKLAIFKKHRAVIEGTADTVRLKKKQADAYRKAHLSGITILPNGVAVISKQAGYGKHEIEKEIPILEGLIKRKKKMANGAYEQIILPHRVDGIRQFIQEAKKSPEWSRLKKDGEQFRFGIGDGTIDGTNWSKFRADSLEQIAMYLEGYESVRKAKGGQRASKLLNALVLIRVKRDSDQPRIAKRITRQATQKAEKEAAYRAAKKKAERMAKKFAKLRKERGG